MTSNVTNKFMNRMFRRINGLVWDITNGQVGVKTKDGIFTLTADGELFGVNNNPLDSLGVEIPAFATRKALNDVQIGDLVVGDTTILGWVVGKNTASLRLLDHTGHERNHVPPKVSVLGLDGVLVVQNLTNLFGSTEGVQGFGAQLLPLMMLGGGDDKLEKLIPFLLMGGAGGQAGAAAPAVGGMNPMLLAMLMKDGSGSGGKIDPMMLMMMGGMGGGAVNPMMLAMMMGGLDGDSEAAPALSFGRPSKPALQRL